MDRQTCNDCKGEGIINESLGDNLPTIKVQCKSCNGYGSIETKTPVKRLKQIKRPKPIIAKITRKQRRENGQCVRCGVITNINKKTGRNYKRCPECESLIYIKKQHKHIEDYYKLKAKGVCTKCYKEVDRFNKKDNTPLTLCSSCYIKKAHTQKIKTIELRKKGVCVRCRKGSTEINSKTGEYKHICVNCSSLIKRYK